MKLESIYMRGNLNSPMNRNIPAPTTESVCYLVLQRCSPTRGRNKTPASFFTQADLPMKSCLGQSASDEKNVRHATSKTRGEAKVDVNELLEFIFPCSLQHPLTTGRLYAFAMHGPLDENANLRAGLGGKRIVSPREIDSMCLQFERDDILRVGAIDEVGEGAGYTLLPNTTFPARNLTAVQTLTGSKSRIDFKNR